MWQRPAFCSVSFPSSWMQISSSKIICQKLLSLYYTHFILSNFISKVTSLGMALSFPRQRKSCLSTPLAFCTYKVVFNLNSVSHEFYTWNEPVGEPCPNNAWRELVNGHQNNLLYFDLFFSEFHFKNLHALFLNPMQLPEGCFPLIQNQVEGYLPWQNISSYYII